MDPEDRQLVSDVELGRGCSGKKKLRGGDDDGAEAVDLVDAEETNPNPAQNLRVCDFCGKTFTSGKALGGHRRSHFQLLKAERQIKKKAIKHSSNRHLPSKDETCGSAHMNSITAGHMSRDEKTHSCYLCGKGFPSMKSLFGHMRSHPGREWKGILPPPTFSPIAADALAPQSEENSCSSSSTSSAPGECNGVRGDDCTMMNPDASSNIPAAIPVDILKDISESTIWKTTAKRGRESVGAVAAAESLVLLSRGKYMPTKTNNQCTEAAKISEFSWAKKRRGIDYWSPDRDEEHKVRKIKLICRRTESVKLGDRAVDDQACKEVDNLFNSSEQNMGDAHEDDENNEVENEKQRTKESKNQEVEEGANSMGTPVMKSSKQFDGIRELGKKKMKKNSNINNKKKMDKKFINVNSWNTDSNKVGRGSKTLPSFQVLQRQRSSQNKDNNSVPSMDEETETTPDAYIIQKVQTNEAKESESIEISNTMPEEEANSSRKDCNQTLPCSLGDASLSEASQSCHKQGASGEAATQSSGKMLDIDLNLPCSMEDEALESSSLQA